LKFDEFHGDNERDGDEIVVEDDKGKNVFDETTGSASAILLGEEIPQVSRKEPITDTGSDSRREGKGKKKGK
jgi:hypothetical protein